MAFPSFGSYLDMLDMVLAKQNRWNRPSTTKKRLVSEIYRDWVVLLAQ